MRLKNLAIALLCISPVSLFAEEKTPVKFGKVAVADFDHKAYAIDSSAHAVVIADVGSTEMVGNYNGWFSLEFNRSTRIHILNKNGYAAANIEIPLYEASPTAKEDIINLKAVTYNLENGSITETKLDTRSAVFEDKLNKHWKVKKFTMPNIKEGAIVEYTYTIKSDFIFNLQPWAFQGKYPCLWSEYNVTIPEFFYYARLMQGYQPFYINSQSESTNTFRVTENGGSHSNETFTFPAMVTRNRYVMKDVPALKEEGFTSTINNHIARINFQLAEKRSPLQYQNVMGNWHDLAHMLLQEEDFGSALSRDNGWLGDIVTEVTRPAKTDPEKAYAIYCYVRDNYTCTSHSSTYLEHPLKAVLKNRNGSEAELNLLLTAMLLKAGLDADPVLLSTRDHGYVMDLYPILDRFNYVITRLKVDNKVVYLDASEPRLGFGRLTAECFNGSARIINEDAVSVSFPADSLKEKTVTSLMLYNEDNGHLSGQFTQNAGYLESFDLRNKLKEKGKEQLVADIKKNIGTEADIKNFVLDSLNIYELPVTMHFDVDLKTEDEDIIYFNPMFTETIKENPFKSAERLYPVEMPYTKDDTYVLRLEIPNGYEVDELPKQVRIRMNEEGDGMFEYLVSQTEGVISLRSRIVINRAFYLPEEYEMLREFYNMIAQKHGEQIVFKKKK